MIRLTHVSKSFDSGCSYAVKDLSFQVSNGETLVLLGSSGCGKTTTLKMVNRLIEPSEGIIEVNGINVMEQSPVALRRQIGYVFQGIGLFPHMTIEKNIGLIPILMGWPLKRIKERVQQLLEIVGLQPENYAKRLPNELSEDNSKESD